MKKSVMLVAVLFVLFAHVQAFAQKEELITEKYSIFKNKPVQTQPPEYVFEDGVYWPVIPGTHYKDSTKPGFKFEGDKIYQTIPGTSIKDTTIAPMKIKKR